MNHNVKDNKGKKKYGFVILHYLAYDMTVECISKLLDKFEKYDMHIVIVDNASRNQSGKKLQEKYLKESLVTVIENTENLGFAKGNNVGYQYLTDRYDMDYIIVMNNDILIEQKEFLDLIDKIYLEQPFDVLGPDIYCPKIQMHQNPSREKGLTKEELLELQESKCHFLSHPMYYYFRHMTLGKVKKVLKKDRSARRPDYTSNSQSSVLHGACYIFSKNYMRLRKNCFNPKTFMYMEEDILYYECVRDGLRMHYDPRIRVQHLEDVSTDASIGSGLKKQVMINTEILKSMEVLLNLMDSTTHGN